MTLAGRHRAPRSVGCAAMAEWLARSPGYLTARQLAVTRPRVFGSARCIAYEAIRYRESRFREIRHGALAADKRS